MKKNYKYPTFWASVLMLMLGALLIQSCEKDKPPVNPPVLYTVTINTIGKIHITIPQVTGLIPGSNIDIVVEPDSLYSVYSIKENGVNMNIIPTDKKLVYSLKNIQSNKILDIEAVETGIVKISILEPALMWTKLSLYKAKDDVYLREYLVNKEQKSRKYYHYYPSMDIKVVNPDGSLYWKEKWKLGQGVYQKGGEIYTVVEITDKIVRIKNKPSFDPYYNTEIYGIYTYERF